MVQQPGRPAGGRGCDAIRVRLRGRCRLGLTQTAGDVLPEPDSLNAQSARNWLYGDLVHTDRTDTGETITDRYIAAVPTYLRIACLAVGTLNMVRKLDGVISLDRTPFDAKVSVEVPVVPSSRLHGCSCRNGTRGR